MKKLILSFILLSGISFAQVDVATAKWKSNMVVDGSASDWKLPLSFYNSETKLFFGIGNDSANLYLSFQSNDEGNQVKINCAGMSISLFSKGKNKCDATINFPLTDKKSRFAEEELIADKKPDIANLKNTFILQNTNMDVSGFANEKGIIPIKDTSGINAAMNWDQNLVMTIEIKIPFKELFGKDFVFQDLTKPISIAVEVNAISEPQQNGAVDGSQAAMSSTGVGAMGMTPGMNNNSGGTIRKERKPIFDKNRFKEKFFVATKPEVVFH